jgi:putative transcriptional regulator
LKLTVEDFGARYRIPAETLHAWEAGTATPDAVAEACLLAIASEPQMVAEALAKARRPRAAAAKSAAE